MSKVHTTTTHSGSNDGQRIVNCDHLFSIAIEARLGDHQKCQPFESTRMQQCQTNEIVSRSFRSTRQALDHRSKRATNVSITTSIPNELTFDCHICMFMHVSIHSLLNETCPVRPQSNRVMQVVVKSGSGLHMQKSILMNSLISTNAWYRTRPRFHMLELSLAGTMELCI
jgi:hypothetical protein